MQSCGEIKATQWGCPGRECCLIHRPRPSAHNVPNRDPVSLCVACLPGVVGGVANCAPQLLCLFLRLGVGLGTGDGRAQRASVAREWSSSPAWPCGSEATCSVSAPPRASVRGACDESPSSHLSCSAHSMGLSLIAH